MDDILTARELAAYLKLNERTVLKLACEGALPGVKIGGQWRFKRSTVDRWLDVTLASGLGADGPADSAMPCIASLLSGNRIVELDASMARDDILTRLVAIAAGAGFVRDPKAVTAALLARETVCSTAIGGGLAFPHTRTLSEREVTKPVIVIGRAVDGVDFSAMDREATYLVVMVCAPNPDLQMRLMGRLSCLMQRPETVSSLRTADTGDEMVRILSDAEQELFGGRQTPQFAR